MKIDKDHKIRALQKQIELLQKENAALKKGFKSKPSDRTVKTPKNIEPIFDKAEKIVGDYFKSLTLQPGKGTIEINNDSYVLVRASALSHEFFHTIKNLYKNRGEEEASGVGKNFLFDIGHVLGMEDAKRFHEKMKLKKPIEKLSAGPVHFAHAGWAFVEILPESHPTPDENFFLKYNHPYSFEADSWIKNKVRSKEPVCTMNAAYSSGWCQESFGIPLTAVEITCRAKGDKNCTFIMAQPNKINQLLKKEVISHKLKKKPEVPFFFERKKIEEEFIKNQNLLSEAQKMAKLGSWEFNLITQELVWSDELYRIYQIDKLKVGKDDLYETYLQHLDEADKKKLFFHINEAIKKKKEYTIKHPIKLPNGEIKWILGSGVPVLDENKKVISLMGIAQDITNEVLQQEKLETNLLEKETLLKEIHHRVKNNLQIISSLLNLQSETIKDKEAKEKYRESLGRVKSMALIHELLYQTRNLSNIKANQYLNQLVSFISDTYNFNKNIKVDLHIDPKIKRIDMNKSIPCDLIINELLSNAFKYAFPNKPSGKINIDFKVLNKKPYNFSLCVSDNGIGLPSHIRKQKTSDTLGLQLVESLTEQLDGKLIIEDQKGTKITVLFN